MGTTTLKFCFTALIACLLVAAPAIAKGEIADVTFGGGQVFFTAKAFGAGFYLVVTGPGDYYHSRTFEPGSAMSWSAVSDKGALADGAYSYELRLIPARAKRGDADRIADGKPAAQMLSGTITVVGGGIVNPELPERITKDQQILDDLIVDGSACIGFDCVNGESFGFDTLRLKENNLRIRFFDTSSSASFPTNDWQITANDTSNGGQNKFSIDDIDGGRTPFTIEASAPSHSLYVDDGGRLGFGTSTPVADLHVKTGNTPTLRLEQDGSSGFTAQTWDVAGNEANFFIRDATNGSTLPIRLRPGAPSSALDIAGDGDIGMGTSSPAATLDVVADQQEMLRVENTAGNVRITTVSTGGEWRLTNNAANNVFRITEQTDGNVEFEIDANGTVQLKAQSSGAFSCTEGSLYYDDTGDGTLCFCSGGGWVAAAGGGGGGGCT